MSETHNGPCGNVRTFGYTVEARQRYDTPKPVVVGGTVLTEKWRRIHFDRKVGGVPNRLFDPLAEQNGLLAYETATALMAWAAASAPLGVLPEFRLVKHRLEYSWTQTEDGVGEAIRFLDMERKTTFTPREAQ